VGFSSASKAEDLLYDWRAVSPATTPVPGYVPAPFVTTGTGASALPTLTSSQAAFPGKVAVKIVGTTPLSPADLTTVFGTPGITVNYAFLDFEGATGQATATAQAAAIHAISPGTITGNFRMFPGTGDTSGIGAGPSVADYLASGHHMANEDLYPGSPFYKNPAAVGGTSSSPNIRSSLFTLPINRASYVTANLPTGDKHIPYVNRFNNTGNPALQNGVTGGLPSFTTADQMLSRGDFSALVAHYRLRGADGYHLLDGGVVNYSQTDFENDAKAGWSGLPAIANIFAASDHRIATLDTASRVDGNIKNNEASGVVYSGVYSLSQANGLGKLALLVSNMDEISHTLDIQQKIGGKNILPGSIPTIGAGKHLLLDFTGSGTQWTLQNPGGSAVFTDTAGRSDVGVPEPVAMGGVGIFAMSMLFRRRRAK